MIQEEWWDADVTASARATPGPAKPMMMPPFQRRSVLSLAAVAVLSCTARAQHSAPPADASIYATRIEKAYRLLGNDLLVIRSGWGPASEFAAAFGQDPNFAYFTGDRTLLGAVLVLDGGARRAEVFLPAVLPPGRSGRPGSSIATRRASARSGTAEPAKVIALAMRCAVSMTRGRSTDGSMISPAAMRSASERSARSTGCTTAVSRPTRSQPSCYDITTT